MSYDATKDAPTLDLIFDAEPAPAPEPKKTKKAAPAPAAAPAPSPIEIPPTYTMDRLTQIRDSLAKDKEAPVVIETAVIEDITEDKTIEIAIGRLKEDPEVLDPFSAIKLPPPAAGIEIDSSEDTLEKAFDALVEITYPTEATIHPRDLSLDENSPLPNSIRKLALNGPIFPAIGLSEDGDEERVFTGLTNIKPTDVEEKRADLSPYASVNRIIMQEQRGLENPVIVGVSDYAEIGGMFGYNKEVDQTAYLQFLKDAYLGRPWDAAIEPAEKTHENTMGIDFTLPRCRPNGEVYYPRLVQADKAKTDMQLDLKLIYMSYANSVPILLYGNPGVGKTAACEAILPGLITLSGTADTEIADFIGSYVQDSEGKFLWHDGPLVEAMENGLPFLIDEIALIDSRVMAVVYSVMDGRNEIRITANPARGKITAKPGFYIIGACNPNVPGAVMSDALTSRFLLKIEYTTDYDMLRTKLNVPSDIVTVAKNLAKRKQDKGEILRPPEARELLAYTKIRELHGENIALANLIGGAYEHDQPVYQEVITNTFAKEPVSLTTK